MKWLKRLALLFAVLVLVLAVIPFFVSVDDYRPGIERLLSERIKAPVRLKSLKLAGLPWPHLVIDGLEIGNADVRVGRIRVTPNLLSMLTTTKIVDRVEISRLTINRAALDRLPLWIKSDPDAKPANFTVLVRSVRFDEAVLQLQNSTVGPFDARVSVGAGGQPERAEISARDGHFRATVKPDADRFNIEVQASSWRLPLGPPILFDTLLLRGVATLKSAELTEINAGLYGGTVTGTTRIDWEQGLRLKGGYAISAVELRALVPLFSPHTRLSGRLTAKPVLSASAASVDQLQNVLKLESSFDVRDGVLQGVDIQKAATSLMTRDSSGETRFDVLSGHFAMERGTRRIRNLKVASGSLAATGHVTVAPDRSLSGRINAQVRVAGVPAAMVPLNISGTVDAPLALPTGAALAGGAIGTAILPGVGTALGAKAGNWAEGVFGGGKKK